MDLYDSFAREADEGFPRLSQIPATNVIQFLDYYAAQHESVRQGFVTEAASFAEYVLRGARGERLRRDRFERMYGDLRSRGPWNGGWRYTDVKFLASVPKTAQFGGMASWLSSYSELARTPRPDLMPDVASFVPAKSTLLRKIVKKVLGDRGYVAKGLFGGMEYRHPEGAVVRCDFGSRMGQLRWDVATPATRAAQPHPGLQFTSYEKLWGLRSDWDYLTEENAPRCIERLPALIDETARMAASA